MNTSKIRNLRYQRARFLPESVLLLVFGLVLASPNASFAKIGKERREHHAHSHGAGSLGIVLEGQQLSVELESPAHDIVGFETQPKTEKQKKSAKEAFDKLGVSTNVLILPEAAKCVLKKTDIQGEVFGAEKGHDDHSEVHVTWLFECGDVVKLANIQIQLFSSFKGIDKLEVTTVNGDKQAVYNLSKKQRVIPSL